MFSRTVLHSRQFGPSGSPSAIKMTFGCVLAGSVRTAGIQSQQEDNCCPPTISPDDFLTQFWEVKDYNTQQPLLFSEEQTVVTQFERNHSWDETGRFNVPLPMKTDVTPLDESSVALRRNLTCECERLASLATSHASIICARAKVHASGELPTCELKLASVLKANLVRVLASTRKRLASTRKRTHEYLQKITQLIAIELTMM